MLRRFALPIWLLLILSNGLSHVFGLIGTSTNLRHYPVRYQVQLHDGSSDFCGGSILGPRHVLTAARCVTEEQKRTAMSGPIYVIAGANNFGTAKDWARVQAVHVPAAFDIACKLLKCLQDDIAVLELKQELHINENPDLGHVNLPTLKPRNSYENKTAVVCGYGADALELKPNGETGTVEVEIVGYPDTLRVAKADVLTQNACREAWSGDIDVGDGHMCARMRGTAYRGVCHGDGGNALVHDDIVIGVVSFGNEFCFEGAVYDGQPSVYTRVSHYVDFIRDAMRGQTSDRVRSYEVDAQSASTGAVLFNEKCVVLLQIVVPLFTVFLIN